LKFDTGTRDEMTNSVLASLEMPPAAADGRTRSAAERAYVAIRQGILDGKIPFETELREDAVANHLDMSRTPVREALQNLAREGLLEPGPRRKLVVRKPTPELCDEILTMRIALECEAVARACAVATQDDLDALRLSIYKQTRAAGQSDVSSFLEADGNFHLLIARAAGFPVLHDTLMQLHAFTRLLGLQALRDSRRMLKVIPEHEAVLQALEERDEEKARVAMRSHLETTGRVLNVR
jgi:DNA-binding GntR family transcriptional regulator